MKEAHDDVVDIASVGGQRTDPDLDVANWRNLHDRPTQTYPCNHPSPLSLLSAKHVGRWVHGRSESVAPGRRLLRIPSEQVFA